MQEYSARERREDLVATEEVCYEIEVLLGDILGRVFWGYGAEIFWRGVWPEGGVGGVLRVSKLVTGGKTLDRKQRKIRRREGGGHLLVIYRGEYDFVVRGSKELRGKRFFSWRRSQRGVREEILATDERVTGSCREAW